jgi:streptogramin lyase
VVSAFTGPGIASPTDIVGGPDGSLWFTNTTPGHYGIGRISTSGIVADFTDPNITSPFGLAVGPDGALWFTNTNTNTDSSGTVVGSSIGRITTDGVVTNYTDPSISSPSGITAGPDGALWFDDGNSIGRISTSGAVQNFVGEISIPRGITTGPDGALWYANSGNNSIGRLTPDGTASVFTDPSINSPNGITAGPDGALWFTNEDNNSIGRITTDGVVTNYTDPSINFPNGITAGPDGALWFTNEKNNSIGRVQAGATSQTPQAITFTSTPPINPVVGGSYLVSATGGGSGDPVAFSIDASSGSGVCGFSSESNVVFTGAGTCVIDANQDGDGTYADAPQSSQMFSIQEAPPTCPGTASDCQSQVSSDPSGSLQVSSGGPNGATAIASGAGALTIGHYSSDPIATTAIGATGEYFDVALSSDNQFTSLGITDCTLLGGNVLEWWNPAASDGVGAWQAVSTQTFVPGSPDCVDATINASTSPSLSELDGTIFAVVSVISAPKVTSASSATFTTGTSGTFTVTTSGFPTPALTLIGTLPSGLTFADNADGTATISGTAASGTAKKYTFTLKAKNTAGSVTQNFTLVVK